MYMLVMAEYFVTAKLSMLSHACGRASKPYVLSVAEQHHIDI